MKKDLIEKERKYNIVKSNELIQKTRYSLNTQEQKLILYLCSKIKPSDNEFETYCFNIKDMCEVLNIPSHGQNLKYFKDSIKSLADKSFWLKTEEKEVLCRWISKASIHHDNKNIIEIRLDEDLKPFLLQLKENFTIYSLENTLCFDSKYSMRIYEILKSYQYKKNVIFTIEELREKLVIDNKYKLFADFKRKVLDISVREINQYSDIIIDYNILKKGNKSFAIEFIIYENDIDDKNEKNRKEKL